MFAESGETLLFNKIEKGANISVNSEDTTKFIINSIDSFLYKNNCSFDDINHFSLGLAGISNKNSREMLFKRLDEKNITDRTYLTSDINPIFEMNCSDNSAVLVNVGTGSVCIGRDEARKLVKERQKIYQKKGKITLQTGYGPSGLPHIGTFAEVARTTMMVNAIKQIIDIPTEIITFSDDMDGLRKVPDNIPKKEILEKIYTSHLLVFLILLKNIQVLVSIITKC